MSTSPTLTFGPYNGQTVAEVAGTSDGLRYLRWLRDQRRQERNADELTDLDRALDAAVGG